MNEDLNIGKSHFFWIVVWLKTFSFPYVDTLFFRFDGGHSLYAHSLGVPSWCRVPFLPVTLTGSVLSAYDSFFPLTGIQPKPLLARFHQNPGEALSELVFPSIPIPAHKEKEVISISLSQTTLFQLGSFLSADSLTFLFRSPVKKSQPDDCSFYLAHITLSFSLVIRSLPRASLTRWEDISLRKERRSASCPEDRKKGYLSSTRTNHSLRAGIRSKADPLSHVSIPRSPGLP